MPLPRSKVQITFADVDEPPDFRGETSLPGPWWAWAMLLAIISVISFCPAVFGSFLPGDDLNLTDNYFLRAWIGLRGVWRFAYNMPQVSPLGYSALLVEYHIWAAAAHHAAWGYHLVNLALHIANVLLLWTLLRKLDVRGALVSAAIFAAHPVQVQTVGWISQQPALLGVMFALMSLIVYLRFCGLNPAPYAPRFPHLPRSPWMLFLIAFVLFLLAILAKPALAVLPAVVLILIWWERGKVSVADFKALSPMLLVMLLTFAAACVNFHHRADIVEQHLSPLKRILIVGPAIWFYLDDIFRPGTFSFVYGRWDPFAWQNAALLLLDLAIILTLWLLHRRIGRAPLACAKLFFTLLVPQILFLDLNQQRDSFVADSVLYLAIVAIIVPAVAVADRWLERSMRSAAPWIGRGVVAAVMAMSFWVSLAYAGPDQLWARAIQLSPRSVYALDQLGMLDLSRKRFDDAWQHLQQALRIDPGDMAAHQSLGAYYEATAAPDKAIGEYDAVLRASPSDVEARCGLARSLAQQGDRAGALREYSRVLSDRPEYPDALNNMGIIEEDLGQYDAAIDLFTRAIRVAPDPAAAGINLANLYFQLGRLKDAIAALVEARRADPTNYITYLNAGTILGKLAQQTPDIVQKKQFLQQAEAQFRQTLYLQNDSAQAADDLGQILAYEAHLEPGNSDKMREAVFYFNRASQLEPNNRDFRLHLLNAQRDASATP